MIAVGLNLKAIFLFVSRNTGYFVFSFAIALSLYQEGNTGLCWQVGFDTLCCMLKYCKTNGMLNKNLFHLRK